MKPQKTAGTSGAGLLLAGAAIALISGFLGTQLAGANPAAGHAASADGTIRRGRMAEGAEPLPLFPNPSACVLVFGVQCPMVAPGEQCIVLGECTCDVPEEPGAIWRAMTEAAFGKRSVTPTPAHDPRVRRVEEETTAAPAKKAEHTRWFRVRCGNLEGWTTRVVLDE